MKITKHFACMSAAILEGAKLRPQGRSFLLDPDGKTCAVGAALDAVGILEECKRMTFGGEPIRLHWPYMTHRAQCPECVKVGDMTLSAVVIHLNDKHEWSREAIAKWLYAEEEKIGFVTVVEAQDTASVSAPTQQFEVASSVRH